MKHERLRSWRDSLSLTQEQAAELLGVHRVTYTRWETGTLPIKERVLLACSAVCKTGPNKNSVHKPIIKAIEEYREAYKYYFNSEPTGKHLVSTPWTAFKYGVFDLSPDNEDV